MSRLLAVVAIVLFTSMSRSAEWEAMTPEFLKAEKPGYGGLSGVVVDRQTSDVYVWVSDKGLFKSSDQGKSFKMVGKIAKGRTEWPGCMQINPSGPLRTWVIALVYGPPILSSADGENFRPHDKKSVHVDWVAVDWSDPARNFMLTLKHESGDLLLASDDGGRSFREVGKGYGPAIIFDNQTAVLVRIVPNEDKKKPPTRELVRTTDGAKTFAKVADHGGKAMPVWYDRTPYWLVENALITSKDQGKSWETVGPVKGGLMGPVFGKDDKHLFVTTSAGALESKDGGKTWGAPIAPPKEFKGISGMTWLAYDPKNDALYLAKMGADLWRLKR